MSKDVEQRLIDIIATQKSFSQEQSKEYLANLEEQNRYLKDVY
jgi:sulfite reductase alpha subunit-like flavoprotein